MNSSRWRAAIDWSGRALGLSLAIAFTAVVLLLAQTICWPDSVPAFVKVISVCVAFLAFVRPGEALLVAAALAPLGGLADRLLASSARGPEALVLAVLSGALLHGWWTGRMREFPSTLVEKLALLFGLVVAASCLEQMWFMQVQKDYPAAFLRDLWAYVRFDYLTGHGNFGMVFDAMLMLEGLGLFVCAAILTRVEPAFARRMVAMLVIGGVGAALLTLDRVVNVLVSTGEPARLFWSYVTNRRWAVHVGDVNATGSYLGLCVLLAFGFVGRRGLARWAAAVGVGIMAAGLWLTGSRAAVYSALPVAVALIAFARQSAKPGAMRRRIVTAAVIVVTVAVVGWQYGFPAASTSARPVSTTSEDRVLFVETGLHMWASRPIFGVGVGQFLLWSSHYFPPLLRERYGRENAHNQYLQIGAELGVVGLVLFASILAATFWSGWRALKGRRDGWLVRAAIAGPLAFCLSVILGHPLMIPEVAYPFWIALGVAAGLERGRPLASVDTAPESLAPGWKWSLVLWAAIAVFFVSLPWRLDKQVSFIDLARVSYGFQRWENDNDGTRFRRAGERATFYVPQAATSIGIPLRCEGNPVEVEVSVDGYPIGRMQLDNTWKSYVVQPTPRQRAKYHRIDLVAPAPVIQVGVVEVRVRR